VSVNKHPTAEAVLGVKPNTQNVKKQ